MTRYSRDSIKDILEAPYEYGEKVIQDIGEQLLEENRILREGLEKYKGIGGMDNAKLQLFLDGGDWAEETLNKADQVGKGKK